jgi:hypothetical protein
MQRYVSGGPETPADGTEWLRTLVDVTYGDICNIPPFSDIGSPAGIRINEGAYRFITDFVFLGERPTHEDAGRYGLTPGEMDCILIEMEHALAEMKGEIC